MRTKLAARNTAASFLLQIVLAISGMIVPRYFTVQYGSAVNGLVSSVTQFIGYLALVEAGVGAAGTVALYAPLAQKNTDEISTVVSTARWFYRRSGILFVLLCGGLVLCYPALVRQEIPDAAFVRMLILILSLTGIMDYFYLGKYRILLLADQRGYVISVIQILGTIAATGLSVGLILLNAGALLVKGAAAAVYLLRSLAVGQYVRRHYPQISFRAAPCPSAFGQRWAALFHQVIAGVVNHSAVVFMTLFLGSRALAEISVYSVYSLVSQALIGLLNSLSGGISSGFGQVIARKERQTLQASFSTYEFLVFWLVFSAYFCMLFLLYPFIRLYSQGFGDSAAYPRRELVVLFTLAGLLQGLRIPGYTMIVAAGHYRQTRGRAVLEAAIHLGVSAALIPTLGIPGAMLGLCTSHLYRTTDMILYSRKRILHGSLVLTFRRLARNVAAFALLAAAGLRWMPRQPDSWPEWFVSALMLGLTGCCAFAAVNCLAERDQAKQVFARIRSLFQVTAD